ncbi:thiamine-repressible mitochondrial transport protein THI74-like [Phalaenopsis equestris]|uniref:thiamine-repressible mitochondrial transport protein THI74-like n=1 Tax=Phalaenopsis equestris TaxID=78828 RepID=UPI0009E584F7|nr:thiamine-repressible mitochondrial transport protein THI74-like [Phalaenopsis equestris]
MVFRRSMSRDTWRWLLGLSYILAVAMIWISASYIVQSVVDAGVSPFLVTYICNSLFLLYIPIVEIARLFEDSAEMSSYRIMDVQDSDFRGASSLENLNLLHDINNNSGPIDVPSQSDNNNSSGNPSNEKDGESFAVENEFSGQLGLTLFNKDSSHLVDGKGQWSRCRVAKISLLICPFWFFGQLTFNLSLKYTTVTSNTILSSASSLFTFFVSLAFLGEKFTWVKLVSVLLCMGGTIVVSIADSSTNANSVATNPVLGDILALISATLYAVYISMIRAKLPDEGDGKVQASTAQFLGYLGLFNFLIFLPVVTVLDFTKLEPFHVLTWKQLCLIVGKGLLDNVLSDYLQVRATQLTSTTAATAGLSVQVPLAAIVDSLTGHAPRLMEYIGAASIMVGFVGINIPSNVLSHSQETMHEQVAKNPSSSTEHIELGRTGVS